MTEFAPTVTLRVEDLVGYAHMVAMRAQLTGVLSLDAPAEEEHEVRRQARLAAKRLGSALQTSRPADIVELAECYDLMYRIGNQRKPPRELIERERTRAFRAWKSGDKDVEESSMVGMLGQRIRFSVGSVPEEQVKAYRAIYQDWMETLKTHGRFPKATSYENFQRLAIVMRDSLKEYLGEEEIEWKRHWYERNKVDDLEALGSRMLRSYRRFVGSLFPAVMDYGENLALDSRILMILSTRRDLNPYDREAYRLALEFTERELQPS